MDCRKLIKKLGYKDNPAFLQGERLVEHPGYSFLFSQAQQIQEGAKLHGIYSLINNFDSAIASSSIIPVVYVFEAENENIASQIHKKVWCQNAVPYVLVTTPKNIRLYSGFEYDKSKNDVERALKVTKDVDAILNILSAHEIDSGNIWIKQEVSTEKRVDRHLLANLKKLSDLLTKSNDECEDNLSAGDAHTLIGKYIYLKYLRDRGILSDMRLKAAEVTEEQVYSRVAQKNKLYDLEKYLDDFLNGSVFPLPSQSRIKTKHIQKVAGAFKGDDPQSGQQVLFDLYDFSYVPIETLSVVYQQFLHQEGEGRTKGAYYTPIHLVNFILDELDGKKPLQEGMTVFDPSCGSGAFLVQCYRRLVERIIRKGAKLKPTDLRKLLVDHIFGLDADLEACRVAELSLSLTLLDYIEPKDLSACPSFKLPDLHDKNIFYCEGGFFDENSLWEKSIPDEGYRWIVGNPPWMNIDKKKDKEKRDLKTIEWIENNKKAYPVDNYQVAEAFTWKIKQLLSEDGQCGLLMPALTLFKTQARAFRSKFFSNVEIWCIVNMANLRHHLFEGAVNPAAAFFFSGKKEWDKNNHYITTYAPFAVEQTSQLSQKQSTKKVWSVFVNSPDVKEIPLSEIQKGSSIPWKIAMWGVRRDNMTLHRASKQNPTMQNYLNKIGVKIAEGAQLRKLPKFENQKEEKAFYEAHEYLFELEHKGKRDTKKLNEEIQNRKIAIEYPNNAITNIKKHEAYLRKRGGRAGLDVSKPPHVLIAASRKYILFSNKYIFVPPRQIGISGNSKQSDLLKCITLYLHSDFVRYHEFLAGEAYGVERECINLNTFKQIPAPFTNITEKELSELSELFDNIVETEQKERKNIDSPLFNSKKYTFSPPLETLLKAMNNKFYQLLGLSFKQIWLIEDMLHTRIKLNDGRIAQEATKLATKKEIEEFASIFQDELDLFIDHTGNKKVHKIGIYYTDETAVIIVDHLKSSMPTKPEVIEVCDDKTRQEFDSLQSNLPSQRSQWIYFTRCLRVYEDRRTYIFKPRQRLYWLKSQALTEADEFIDEKVRAE